MRVNEVISTSRVGANVRIVSSSRICSEKATSCGLVAGDTPMLMRGIGIVGAAGPGICAMAGSATASAPHTSATIPASHQSERRVLMSA